MLSGLSTGAQGKEVMVAYDEGQARLDEEKGGEGRGLDRIAEEQGASWADPGDEAGLGQIDWKEGKENFPI